MGWSLIEHKSAPASNVFDFTSLDLSSYQRAILLLDGIKVDTDDADVLIRLYIAGSLISTGYRYITNTYSSSGTTQTETNAAATGIILNDLTAAFGVGNAAEESLAAKIEISNPAAALNKLVMVDCVHVFPSGNMARVIGGGVLANTGTMDGLKVLGTNGLITAGKASLYGLTTS